MDTKKYFDERRDLRYYQRLKELIAFHSTEYDCRTVIDIASGGTDIVLAGDYQSRVRLDRETQDYLPGVLDIQASFLGPIHITADLALSCQVIEHLETSLANEWCEKLFGCSRYSIISVPYKWSSTMCDDHVQDPIDIPKLVRLTGKTPNYTTIVREDDEVERLIASFINN